MTDVTALLRAEARFRGLLESAPDGIVVVDRGGTIVIVNSQTERMFGYSRDELIGNKIELLVPASSRGHHARDRAAYASDPRTRPMGAGRALTGRKKNGSEFPVEISLSPLITDQEALVMSIVRDITDRRRAEELIQASLREKEALLREIHHRVKNNLQITSSLLRLQAGAIENPEAREVFAETQHRIRSMALVHEKLYQSTNLSLIDFGDYIRTLGDLLFQSFAVDPSRVLLTVVDDEVLLSIDTAVPCGLIVNELLLNALKHAFPEGGRGEIVVELSDSGDGWCRLAVRDDGVGLPDDMISEGVGTLGLQLVRGLVAQLDGRLAVERGRGGAGFTIHFPKERAAHGWPAHRPRRGRGARLRAQTVRRGRIAPRHRPRADAPPRRAGQAMGQRGAHAAADRRGARLRDHRARSQRPRGELEHGRGADDRLHGGGDRRPADRDAVSGVGARRRGAAPRSGHDGRHRQQRERVVARAQGRHALPRADRPLADRRPRRARGGMRDGDARRDGAPPPRGPRSRSREARQPRTPRRGDRPRLQQHADGDLLARRGAGARHRR